MNNTYTLILPKDKLDILISHYQAYESFNQQQTIAHLFLPVDCRITVYHSGKILFQGKRAQAEYAKWNTAKQQTPAKTTTEKLLNYIGCDETGVGDYFAPLIAAACYVDTKITKNLEIFNIKDSKQLTDAYICEIAPQIKKIVPHTIYTLSNEQYNLLIDNGYNSHAIKAFVHNKAIGKLMTDCNLPLETEIVMDQFVSKQNYQKYLKNITPLYLPTIFETKAENKYLGVACASILAREQFLLTVSQNSEKYGHRIPLGAGKKVDTFSKVFLQEFGEDELKKNVKWHFANTKRILNQE